MEKGNTVKRQGTSLKFGSPALKAENVRFLKIRVTDYDLDMWYSQDGSNWTHYPNSMNLQGYQHNILGRFSSLKPAIYWKGNGRVKVDKFVFRGL
jgi:beta-xylosidase